MSGNEILGIFFTLLGMILLAALPFPVFRIYLWATGKSCMSDTIPSDNTGGDAIKLNGEDVRDHVYDANWFT